MPEVIEASRSSSGISTSKQECTNTETGGLRQLGFMQKTCQPNQTYLADSEGVIRTAYVTFRSAFCHRNTDCQRLSLRLFAMQRIYHFGVLTSAMHMAWMRTVCGRLKSDYQYSAGIVYNNFPWPQNLTDKQKQAIEAAAQGVLEARAHYPGCLPGRPLRPPDHAAGTGPGPPEVGCRGGCGYAKRKFTGDRDRLAFLFELYQQILSPLSAKKNLRRK